MSRLDARLGFTLLLRPPAPIAEVVAWPGLLTALLPDLALPTQDPLQAVLDGAFGRLVLRRRPLDDDCGLIVSGLGDVLGVTASVRAPGEVDENRDPLDELRARALDLLGITDALAGDEDALSRSLASESGPWSLDGLVEVSAELLEGLPEDLDDDLPAAEVGNVQIVRAGGVGQGHVGWSLLGSFGRSSERPVASWGVLSLCEGHLGRVAPLVAYGAAAIGFGAALARARRQMAALDGLVPLVQAACSWATAKGPWPGAGDAPDYAGLAARLELLKVGLRESHEALRSGRGPLREAATRALVAQKPGEGGPFVEASQRGEHALDRVAAREESVARWAGALALARQAAGA